MTGRPTILLVDDDQAVVRLYARAIQMRGFDVVIRNNAREALATHRETPFRLIISDVRMDGMDGYEFCRALVDENLKSCPVIFATADDEIATVVSLLESGGDDLIIKGSAFDDIMARVTFWFSSRFPGLPRAARDKALGLAAGQPQNKLEPIAKMIRIDRGLIDHIAGEFSGELQKMPPDYGARLVERIIILGRISRLVLDDCDDLGLAMRFADHLTAVIHALRLPFGSDLNVLFARYDTLAVDERFRKAADSGLSVISD